MSNHPVTVILHTVSASHGHDEDAEHATLEDVLGIDIAVAKTSAESKALIQDAEIVIGWGISEDLIDAAENLRWVQALSSGVDYYPLDRLRSEGIVLTNVAGIHARPVAEQVFGYMLMFSRRLHRGLRQQRESRWERYEGIELTGKTLGIVGVGEIGSRVAEIAQAFDMTVLGTRRDHETVPDGVDEMFGSDQLYEVLPRSDYVLLSCPLTEETRGMIGAEELGVMKNSAVLINVARGGLVDYGSLTKALQQKEISGAGLDVFPEEPYDPTVPLWNLSNVVMTPHMAGSTPHKPARVADVFSKNYRAFTEGDLDAMPTRVV